MFLKIYFKTLQIGLGMMIQGDKIKSLADWLRFIYKNANKSDFQKDTWEWGVSPFQQKQNGCYVVAMPFWFYNLEF